MKRSAFYTVLLVLVVPFCKADTTEEMLSACRPMIELKIAGEMVSMPRTFEAGVCWGTFAVIQHDTRWLDAQ